MKSTLLAGALAASTLWFAAPAAAQTAPALPAPLQTAQAGSVRIDRYSQPGKQSVVFIPGLTCGPWEFAREIRAFSQYYTVYALTLPGFDGHPAIAGPLFSTVSADIWKALDAQHVAKPVLIGHSLGGTMALLLASQHADRLRGVVAIDGLPVFPGAEKRTAEQRAATAAQMSAMMAAMKTPAQFEAAERTYVLPYLVTSPQDVAAIAPLAARSDPAATGRWAAEDYAQDLRPLLKTANVPVLEIAPYDPASDRSSFATEAAKQQYYAQLLGNAPSASVRTIAPSRHFVMYDRPAELDAVLNGFLETNRAVQGL